MNFITNKIRAEREYASLVSALLKKDKNPAPCLASGLCDGARVAVLATLIEDVKKRGISLIVLPDEKQASRLSELLKTYGVKSSTYLPRDFVIRDAAASHDFEHERLLALNEIIRKECDVVLTTPDAALQYTIPPERLLSLSIEIDISKEYEPSELCAHLISCGYICVDMVDGVGQFSHRGGIIDIYPPNTRQPIRIEFFDTVIDRMAYFDVLTQRYTEEIEACKISPVREVVASGKQKEALAALIKEVARKVKDFSAKDKLFKEAETLVSGRELACIDKYISYIYPEKKCLLDYFNNDSLIVIIDYSAVADRMNATEWKISEDTAAHLSSCEIIPGYADFSTPKEIFTERIFTSQSLIINTFTSSMGSMRLSGLYSFKSKQTGNCFDNFALLLEELYNYKQIGYKTFVVCDTVQAAKNLVSMLNESSYTACYYTDDTTMCDIVVGVMAVTNGFELPGISFAVVSSSQGAFYQRRNGKAERKASRKSKKSGEKIFSYTDLSEGDYVVHEKYGIGRYLGSKSLVADGVRRDFVQIQYSGSDMLYLPCGQLDMLSKYVGSVGEDTSIKLSKMGGAEWTKAKVKVKAAAKSMAKELIALYAERMRRKGYSFSPPSAEDMEFADNFEYEETQGQLNAIDDIFEDMEKPYPMDRLLCGDVGYGKTEVALRAAFKAVCDGKQVAILVPTTILALQHYETITSRMRGFPINVDMLSRFRNSKQQLVSLRKLARGETDIIVGTHRLLSKDIEFHDLGLVIIDEEQRFGVAQKERLKQIAHNVDTLTLTATPIPRTLNMAMSGIRDMSVLEEAPCDRFPVQSYVAEYDDAIVFDAIRRELRRGGQVFYLCNKIEKMDSIAAKIVSAIPDARVATANGQMDKEELSDIWNTMLTGDVDILVCTTIIETGIDIPNANTLIIEDADKMGLSQLHQLRGRVGRSSRRAYAYFTYPQDKVLTEIATKRLEAIRDFTEFGAGFKIAMRDLQIRGAGNILGAEQHGHISSVGYELYIKLLENAILEERGESEGPKESECTIDISVDAYIPENYISGSTHRLEAYKKISLIRNLDDRGDVIDEILDRYGPMPQCVSNLINVSYLRATGSKAGLAKIEYRERSITFRPERINLKAWSILSEKTKGKLLISLGGEPYITCRVKNPEFALDTAQRLLDSYLKIVDSEKDGSPDKNSN